MSKYVLRPPRDLRSKFLLAMEQRELDKMKAEEERIAEERRKLMEELEQPPFDELYGLRVHSWVLLLPGGRSVESPVFLEPSKGSNHPVDSPLYCGVESVWNNENYWVKAGSFLKCAHCLFNLMPAIIGEPFILKSPNSQAHSDTRHLCRAKPFFNKMPLSLSNVKMTNFNLLNPTLVSVRR